MAEERFDLDTEEYLASLHGAATRNIKKCGLQAFLGFYKEYCVKQGITGGFGLNNFFDRVDADLSLPKRQRQRVAKRTLRAFVSHLIDIGLKDKTVRAYVCAVRTLGEELEYTLPTKDIGLPPSETAPENVQHSWKVDEVDKWVQSIKSQMYRALSTAYYQSGCDISTLHQFTYGDVKAELIAGTVPLCLERTVNNGLTQIEVSRKKTKVKHRSFLGAWAVTELKAYLATRGDIKDQDKLFPVGKSAIDAFFLRHARKFKKNEAFKGRNPFRPHSLRGGMLQACKDHKTDPDYAKYLAGKKVKEDVLDYINKDREGWRQIYTVQVEPWVTPRRLLRKELVPIVDAWDNMIAKTQLK